MLLPDTYIREDAGSSYLSDFKDTPVRLYRNGLNYLRTRSGSLTVTASLDFTTYPYDQQLINVRVGSW